jgi:hypothetical protein
VKEKTLIIFDLILMAVCLICAVVFFVTAQPFYGIVVMAIASFDGYNAYEAFRLYLNSTHRVSK